MVTLKTYYLDVKDAVRALHRFELRFEDDNEAVQHSKELAAKLQQRRVSYDQGGLTIAVLDQSNRRIHEETVYPPGQQTNLTTDGHQPSRPHFAKVRPQASAAVQTPD